MKISPYLCKKERSMENDIFKKKILSMYRDIDKVPELELEDYMNYCDKAPANSKDYQSFKTFNEMKEKCRKKGLESILFRSDVIGVAKDHYKEGWGGPHDVEYDYILVSTKYGNFRYTKSGMIL